ncbi:non-ribosomal peptide synthetase [Amycolatopsis kentuckyensis]|uniref:non-ribosomal peptide synthetase n=1 Tax=Amycolatopsis kentuckyensis TaxID=218823 RepID=UPI003562ED61
MTTFDIRPAAEPADAERAARLRAAVLAKRLRGRAATPARAFGRAGRGAPLPLSAGQQRLWFLDRLDPDSAEYAVPLLLRLEGTLDVEALRRSLDALVARHEILRTTYTAEHNRPRQVIGAPAPVDLPVVEGDLGTVLAEYVGRPFDLAAGPVFRALLVREAPERHVLALNVHHIACDGWSLPILMDDLRKLYTGAELPPVELSYADFAVWEQSRVDAHTADLAYWKERLAGLETLELPADRPRPAQRDHHGASVRFTIPAAAASAVIDQGKAAGATPFMTLLAAAYVVLGRHTGRTDIAVGTPVAGRGRAELEHMVGFFVNTVVARGDLSGDPDFATLADRVRVARLADQAHEDLPFEALVKELAPERNLAHTPVVQVMFAVYDSSSGSPDLGDLRVSPVDLPSTTAKFDLMISFVRQADGSVEGVLEYATALFDEVRMARMGEHFVRLFTELAARPGVRLSEVDVLGADERELLLETWNATAEPYLRGTLHGRIAAQAMSTPDAIAVRCGQTELTYAELEDRATRLAQRLRAHGVGVETPVGVLCERGPLLLPVLLAILKTGGHYIPLDPAYPQDRKEYMLRQAGARVLVTTRRFAGEALGDVVVFADEPVADDPVPWHDPVVDPENLAYVIYTSGSTGRPKGVMISHRGVLHYLDWCRQAYRADEGEGAPVHSSLAFDLTVTGLFLPLLCGTTVTLVPEDEHPVAGLADVLSSGRKFSFVKLTPAHLEPLRRCLAPEAASAAAHLVVGGEQLTAEALEFWRENAPDVVVANEYGHTETSVANVINLLPAAECVTTPISVGRPIWNTEVYLLDEHLRPVPVGVTGELYAGGAGVARGFAGNPGLTAAKYVPNPFGPGRLYRSGDLARYLPDGRLEFVGRTDHQVKVRGYRIELGEIEAALVGGPGVTEAVAVVRDGALAGYVSPSTVDVDALRAHLSERLPEYMVPTTLTTLDTLPLTSNGKIDRVALPAPDAAPVSTSGVLPRDELEMALAKLWEDLLGRRVGVTDGFFDVGGHSLLAVVLVDRIQAELGATVGLAEVFRAPTIRALADLVRAGDHGGGLVVPLSPGRAGVAPLFLLPPTAGSPFPYLQLVAELDPALPVFGLQAPGFAPGEDPVHTIEELAAAFVADLLLVVGDRPIRLAGWSQGGSVAFEMAAQLENAGRAVEHLCIIDATVLGVDDYGNPLPEVDTSDPLAWFGEAVLKLAPGAVDTLDEMLAEARDRGMVSEVAGNAVVEQMARVYLAGKDAVDAYRCRAVVDTGIHLITSTGTHPVKGRPEVRPESWRARTRGELTVTPVPGHHWDMVEPPHVAELARAVLAGLAVTADE